MKRLITLLALVLASMATYAYSEISGFVGETWYDHRASSFAGGTGTEGKPYLIDTPDQLALLAWKVNEEGKDYAGDYFRINADLSLRNYVWVPIGITSHPFKGIIINPDKHVITGMIIHANGTGKTTEFGLFGEVSGDVNSKVNGTIDGLILKKSIIHMDMGNSRFYLGTICGTIGQQSNYGPICYLKNCTAEVNMNIDGSNGYVGGIVGFLGWMKDMRSCRVENSAIIATNTNTIGGITGRSIEGFIDCHANINIKNTETSGSYVGGLIGYFEAYDNRGQSVRYSSTAGEINCTGTGSYIGGLFGYCYNKGGSYRDPAARLCATAMSLKGQGYIGGLAGYSQYGASRNHFDVCLSSSFIDGKEAQYVGGFFGYLKDLRRQTWADYVVNECMFTGTIVKPENSQYFGVMTGDISGISGVNYLKFFGKNVTYDRLMCDLQLATKSVQGVKAVTTQIPEEGYSNPDYYAAYRALHEKLGPDSVSYKPIFELCSYPFHITSDFKTLYCADDVTGPFSLENYENMITGEKLTNNFLEIQNASCVSVSESTDKPIATPLDPGEEIVIIRHKDIERKVHLYITYGKDWDGSASTKGSASNGLLDAGSGTQRDPYILHSARQLAAVMGDANLNKSGKYFRLANDLFINTHLLQDNGEPRTDAKLWTPQDWRAHLDGAGHTIYGLYVKDPDGTTTGNKFNGLFRVLKEGSSVSDLAVVDSYVCGNENDINQMGYYGSCPNISLGIICGYMEANTTIERCMTQGHVVSDRQAGGICGLMREKSSTIRDCFSDVHLSYLSDESFFQCGGITSKTDGTITRCLSVGRSEQAWPSESDGHTSGIASILSNGTVNDSYFDQQQMDYALSKMDDKEKACAKLTAALTGESLSAFSSASAWLCQQNRYPMLRQFAYTNPGKLISMPVSFFAGDETSTKIDRAGSVTEIFEFLCEDGAQWKALNGTNYVDVINECEAASLNGGTDYDAPEMFIGELSGTASKCTSIKRVIPIDIKVNGKVGIRFADSNIKEACLAAFDVNPQDGLITLRESFEATSPEKWSTFNTHASAKEGVRFNELRYFAGITDLTEGIISGLDKLSQVVMPKQLQTISKDAFNGCSAIESVTLPMPFENASPGAFHGSGIKDIYVNHNNATLESRNGMLFTLDDELMAYPPARGQDTATVSGPLATILEGAFYKVPALQKIYLDNPLPVGYMAELDEDGIIPCDDEPLVDIYINDGSTDGVIAGNDLFGTPELYTEYLYDDGWRTYDEDGSHLHRYFPLTVTDAMWATLYIGFATQLPEELSPYIVTTKDVENKKASLKRISSFLPRETPVAIKAAEAGRYLLYPYTEEELPQINKSSNWLIGTFIGQDGNGDGMPEYGVPVTQGDSDHGSVLTLGINASGNLGFFYYKVDGMIPPYKAYLTVNTVTDEARGFNVTIDNTIDDQTDGIANISNTTTPSIYYDLQGRSFSELPTRPGMYIHNGRKIMVR